MEIPMAPTPVPVVTAMLILAARAVLGETPVVVTPPYLFGEEPPSPVSAQYSARQRLIRN